MIQLFTLLFIALSLCHQIFCLTLSFIFVLPYDLIKQIDTFQSFASLFDWFECNVFDFLLVHFLPSNSLQMYCFLRLKVLRFPPLICQFSRQPFIGFFDCQAIFLQSFINFASKIEFILISLNILINIAKWQNKLHKISSHILIKYLNYVHVFQLCKCW